MTGHRVLVVEDDPLEREAIMALIRGRGDDPRGVATVEEALAAMEEETFCYYVFDQALPLAKGCPAYTSGGERLVIVSRAKDPRMLGPSAHVTPSFALTNFSDKAPFVTNLHELGLTTFLSKPVGSNQTYILEKMRNTLLRAGRRDHAACAALARAPSLGVAVPTPEPAPPAPPRDGGVRIAIDGTVKANGRTPISINGFVRDFQDSKLVPLLRAIVARERGEEWTSRDSLGIGANRAVMTHIRDAFDKLVPDAFQVLEGDRRGNARLNPAIVVERVDWDALARHPDPAVQRLAAEQQKRREER